MTGDLTIPDKIIHSGDTNTAIRFPSADTVTVETGGSEALRITSAGNVGIGTTSPAKTLDVSGAIRASTGILFGSDTAAVNTLDDYEEGTFGYQMNGLTLNYTFTSRVGKYTVIGDVAYVWFTYEWTSANLGTGNTTIGLPFTAAEDSILFFGRINNTIAADQIYGKIVAGSKSVLIYGRNNGSGTEVGPAQKSNWGGSNIMSGFAAYKI
jgi:hypothetical protein